MAATLHLQPLVEQRSKVDQRVLGARAQRRRLVRGGGEAAAKLLRRALRPVVQYGQGGHRVLVDLGRPRAQRVDRLGADAAAWLVDDALQRHAVGRVVDEAQIGQRVLDFLALVETRGADEFVADAAHDERFFQCAALRVGAIGHGEVARLEGARGDHLLDLVGHERSLLDLVVCLIDHDRHALAVVGVQPLGRAVAILRNERVGHVEDRLRAAIVLLQQDQHVVRIVAAEELHVAIISAAEAVDRLILVADHKEIAVVRRLGRQQPQHLVLRGVRVLELVDEQVGPLALVLDAHLDVVAQQQHRAHEQVVEIHGIIGLERLLVAAIDAAGDLLEVGGGLVGVGRHQVVLAVADVGVDGLGREALLVQVQLAHNGAHQRHLVTAVIDRPVRLVADRRRLHA